MTMMMIWGNARRAVLTALSLRRGGGPSPLSFSVASSRSQPQLMESIQNKIKTELNAEAVSVKDLSGDGRHVSIEVISETFEGQSKVNRQRMVYKVISEELQSVIHAVDNLETKTPNEASV